MRKLKIATINSKKGITASFLGIILLLLLSWSGCYEPIEDCQDTLAKNFNVDADKDCCCEYPLIRFNFDHRWDTLPFSFTDSLSVGDDLIDFSYLTYYVSNIRMIIGGETVRKRVTFDLTYMENGVEKSTTTFKDFILVNPSDNNYSFGEVLATGRVDSLYFTVGIEYPYYLADPTQFESGNGLAFQADSLNWNEDIGYVFNRLQYFPVTSSNPTDSITIEIGQPNAFDLGFAVGESFTEGQDFRFNIEVDYRKWFEGVDVVNDPVSTITQKIANNTSNAFVMPE